MNTHTARILAPALALGALALAGCSTAPAADTAAPQPAASEATTTYAEADVMFAEAMVPHHEQAVAMADVVLAKDGIDARVVELAEQIKAAQEPEIERLNAMLDSWGGGTAGAGHGGHGGMGSDGMTTDQDLAALEQAEGAEASRLFLEQMIAHHEGAVMMAEAEVSAGVHPDAVAMAQQIIDTQRAEIETMREILASL